MAEGTVRVAPDSTGKIIRTEELTVLGTVVEQQVTTVADAAGNLDGNYAIATDYAGGTTLIYAGKAAPGTLTSAASWQIKKLAYDAAGNLTGQTWAGGATTFVNVWTNRVGLTYN